jgi:hypothetical protein
MGKPYHRVDLGIRHYFNIPKLHKIHYVDSFIALGTADGYNTEFSERLHFDFAKMRTVLANNEIAPNR